MSIARGYPPDAFNNMDYIEFDQWFLTYKEWDTDLRLWQLKLTLKALV